MTPPLRPGMAMTSSTTGTLTFKAIGEALKPVQDPEIRMGITELGLIYGVQVRPMEGEGNHVTVRMSLTSPQCPYGPMLLAMVHGALAKLAGVRDVSVDLTFEPLWDPKTMASEECKDALGIF